MDALTEEQIALALAALFLMAGSLGLRWLVESARPKEQHLPPTRPNAGVIDFWAWRAAQRRRTGSRNTNH